MPCRSAYSLARDREATAPTTTSSRRRAGTITAAGAIPAAPSTPITCMSAPIGRDACGSSVTRKEGTVRMRHDAEDPDRYARYPSLSGRTAFVSGGASGLGEEFVRHLAHQGAKVGFVDIDEPRGRALA